MTTYSNYHSDAEHFYLEVAKKMNSTQDGEHTPQITAAVLHVLRDRITYRESMFLVSDLPLLLKGLYFDGWKMNQPPTPVFTMEDFLEEVKKNVIEYFGNQFSRIQLTVDKVKAVIQVLRDYVSANGFWHIRNQMPKAAIGLFDVEE